MSLLGAFIFKIADRIGAGTERIVIPSTPDHIFLLMSKHHVENEQHLPFARSLR